MTKETVKISKSWLTEYLPQIGDKSDPEIAELFHLAGIEVESIQSGLDSNVVVAEILNVDRHPNADRLSLADVTDSGSKYKVVCGAPNIQKGQRVPLAKIGAVLPSGLEIKKTVIRGVESEGMLCAADELGLGPDHMGIIILPNEYELGKTLNTYLKNDTVFDISITPNRGDWLSHFGIARELGAFMRHLVKKNPLALPKSNNDINSALKVIVIDSDNCPQYFARVIKGVVISDSPDWLKEKLDACGIRSINNVVDITNYILLDLGHPLHAFDYKKTGKEITIRAAKEGERIRTLDGNDQLLTKDNLVIADKEKAIAIAGVMGGGNSEVSNNTVDIVLEAAVFNPKSIRKTSKQLKLQSDASYRFERGVDAGGTEYAINKAAKLIAEIANGKVMAGIIKVGEAPAQKKIPIDVKKINALLGLSLTDEQIRRYLKLLGFEFAANVTLVPLWRNDITIIEDLAEEVGRMNGYDKIKPIFFQKTEAKITTNYYKDEFIKDVLVKSGFSETISYPYLSEKDIDALKLSKNDLLEVANPLQDEYKYLRISLLPGLIKAVAKNPAFDPVLLFEISHVYRKTTESTNLGVVASGKNAKSLLEGMMGELSTALNKKIPAEIQEFPKEQLARFKVKKPSVATIEIAIEDLLKGAKIDPKNLELKILSKDTAYRPVSRFPMITRDLAFVVDRKVNAQDITAALIGISELINRVELFDEYVSDQFGKGKKSVAFHIYLQHMDRTLTDKEADEVVEKIIKYIKNTFDAELRS